MQRLPFQLPLKNHNFHQLFDHNHIYDKEVRLQFVDYIREEKKFESADLLAMQIKKDCEDAKKILA